MSKPEIRASVGAGSNNGRTPSSPVAENSAPVVHANQVESDTTTRHPVVRLLFVALAFILVNLWVWLLWTRLSATRRGGRQVYQERFRLKTMLEFLRHAIERRFPLIHVVAIPASG